MATEQSTVTYREIPGYPGYRVGDDGSVWSRWERYGEPGFNGSRCRIGSRWKQLNPYTVKGRYPRVQTLLSPSRQQHVVARLVLLAFVGPCPPGCEVCHADGSPGNNALSNLRWDTPKANTADSIRHGTFAYGTRNGQSRFTDDDIRQIRAEYAAGRVTRVELAARYGTDPKTIWQIATGRRWKHIV